MKGRASVKFNSITLRLFLVVLSLSLLVFLVIFVIRRTVASSPTGFQQKSNIVQLWESGDYARVLAYSEGLLERNPIDARALFFSGAASYYLLTFGSNPENQSQYLNQAILNLRIYLDLKRTPPYAAEAHYILGKSYYEKGAAYMNLVLQHLQKAISLGYQNTDIAEYIGMAYIATGEYKEGIDYLEKAAYRENNYELEYNIANAYTAADNYDEALKLYQNVYANSTSDSLRDQARLKIAQSYFKSLKYDEAKALLVQHLRRYPSSTEAYYILGEIYHIEKNFGAAKRQWENIVRLDPLNIEALTRLYGG
ncbi:MAG: tetratricopeptide repeat protein [Spirochaetia bacterium]